MNFPSQRLAKMMKDAKTSLLLFLFTRYLLDVVRGDLLGVAVDELDAHLLGKAELDLLAVGLAKGGRALLNGLGGVHDLGLSNTLLLGDDLAADTRELNGLVHAGLGGLGVADADIDIDGVDLGHVVGSLLGNLLAVLVAVRVVAMTVAGLADSDHLDVSLLLESNLDSLGSGILVLLVIGVAADLVVDGLNGLSADGAGRFVAVFSIDDLLDGKVDVLAGGLEGGRADLGGLSHFLDGAVVPGLLIAVMGLVVRGGGVVVRRLGVVRLGLVVRGLRLVVSGLGRVVRRLGGLVVVVDGLIVAVSLAMLVAVRGTVMGEGGERAGIGPGSGQLEEGNDGNESLNIDIRI